jgi:hypothetical protein
MSAPNVLYQRMPRDDRLGCTVTSHDVMYQVLTAVRLRLA